MKPLPILIALAATLHAAPPEPKFRAVTIDDKIQIGYGVAVADVDGDKHPDILLADKKQFAWYRNPGVEKSSDPATWAKFVLAENLTEKDNVCLAAQDIDGDGKCEIAVGAEWNPGDTVNSGAVFYLIAPADRTQKWEAVKFPNVEPTTHRMKWLRVSSEAQSSGPGLRPVSPATSSWGLVVVPLHGRGNKGGEGTPVKVMVYYKPAHPKTEWKSEVLDESMHMTHNFHLTAKWHQPMDDEILLAGREGVAYLRSTPAGRFGFGGLQEAEAKTGEEMQGAGEIRDGWLLEKGGLFSKDKRWLFYTTIEPMHGNRLVVTPQGPLARRGDKFQRHILTDKLTEGHALACGDLLGVGSDQIIVGWRGTPGKEGSTIGVHVWTQLDGLGKEWRDSAVDDGGMACEDLVLADLNGDGKLDIIASGRATHNVKVYFNETPR